MTTALAGYHRQDDHLVGRDPVFDALQAHTTGEYRILERLGRGGMASVYLAHDIGLDRLVALKVMHAELLATRDMRRRFLREARLAARLSHPHIVTVHGIRQRGALIFADLGRVEGVALDELLKREGGPLQADIARWLVVGIADALHYAHTRGVVHRDVKPSNVIVDRRGDPIVADFGIAIAVESVRITDAGMVLGTPSYMSPEQCRGREPGPASDQYALGILAYELLAGRVPFQGPVHAVQRAHVSVRPPVLHHVAPRVPLDLSATIMRMLEKRPEDRWPTVADAAEALTRGMRMSESHVRQCVRDSVARVRPTPVSVEAVVAAERSTSPAPAPTSARTASTEVLPFRQPLRQRVRGMTMIAPVVLAVALAFSFAPRAPATADAQASETTASFERDRAAFADSLLDTGDTTVLRVDVTPLIRLAVGESVKLYAQALNRTGEPVVRRLRYRSGDSDIVEAFVDGWVRGVKAGWQFVKVSAGRDSAFALVVVQESEQPQ